MVSSWEADEADVSDSTTGVQSISVGQSPGVADISRYGWNGCSCYKFVFSFMLNQSPFLVKFHIPILIWTSRARKPKSPLNYLKRAKSSHFKSLNQTHIVSLALFLHVFKMCHIKVSLESI